MRLTGDDGSNEDVADSAAEEEGEPAPHALSTRPPIMATAPPRTDLDAVKVASAHMPLHTIALMGVLTSSATRPPHGQSEPGRE